MAVSRRFRVIEYEEASEELKAIYDDTMETMCLPFVLNWFKCQANNVTLLRGNWQKVKATLYNGQVPILLKQLILYNVSKRRGCQYGTHFHGASADALSRTLCDIGGFRVTQNLDSAFVPSSYKTAIRIVTRCALDPLSTTDDDFAALRNEGFSDAEIQELMAQADLGNMLNTIANVSGIAIDHQLEGMYEVAG